MRSTVWILPSRPPASPICPQWGLPRLLVLTPENMSKIKHIVQVVSVGMPLQYFVDSGAYKRAGSEYFVVLLHVFCTVVRIKSDED